MTGDVPLEPGAVLTTAVLGPCVGGVLRAWTEGGSSLWAPEDPAALRELMGRGLLARTRVGPDRYREVGLLDAASGALALVPRFPSSTDADGVTLDGRVISLREAGPATDSATEEFLQFLGGAMAHAEESGEHLILEKGDSASPSEPCCPVEDDATAVADAVASWGVEPWDTVLTFWRPTESSATRLAPMEAGPGIQLLKFDDRQCESFARDGYVVVYDALPAATITRWRERAHELFSHARDIDKRSDEHVLTYRVLTGDVIRDEFVELYDFYTAPSTLRWVAAVTGEREIYASPNLRSAVNVNILQSGDSYRWHFDANPYTALLYLSTTVPSAGGELELYPNLGPQNTSPEDLAAREKVTLPTRAGTLVLMDGSITYHHVAPVVEACDRLSVPMVYPPFREELRPPELDDYLYGSDS